MNSNVLLCLAFSGFAKADECKSPARAILKESFLFLKGSDLDSIFSMTQLETAGNFPLRGKEMEKKCSAQRKNA